LGNCSRVTIGDDDIESAIVIEQTRWIQDWSYVRAFLASDQVRADKAVRAPVPVFLESAVAGGQESGKARQIGPSRRGNHLASEFNSSKQSPFCVYAV
jgi:uncharacterized protein YpuA (DUF1002 family)